MAVSYNTSPEVRRGKLSPLFIRLVSDPCRWVSAGSRVRVGVWICDFVLSFSILSLQSLAGMFRAGED